MYQVFVVMGSDSDWPIVKKACEVLKKFNVSYCARVISAHRAPDVLHTEINQAEKEGTKVFIAAAGVAAHLAGVVASLTTRPVVGIPIASGPLQGNDALLAMVQMPPGIPVGTLAIDGAMNAGLYAVQILATSDPQLAQALQEDRSKMKEKVLAKDKKLQEDLP